MNTKKTGWKLIFRPIVSIFVIVILFIITSFLEEFLGDKINIINYLLSIAGMIASFAFIIGVPIGIYFIKRKIDIDELKKQETYKSLNSENIYFIADWSWTAFFVSPIWALGNNLYLYTLGLFVPIFNIYIWLKLAAHGRKISWEKNKYENIQLFKKRQKNVMWISVLAVIIGYFVLILFFNN